MMDLTKIADSLPTREDVLNAIGMASHRSAATEVSSMLGVFGAGMLIGAGLALLFAPKTGSALRQDIESRVSDLRQNLGQRPQRDDRSASTGSFAGAQGAAV